ncbi:putative sn1-specific diacylglycerol lipase alpha [Apostichopus japonicus]|uniref:sn-1-specific diacylglycerol lipase n=1 Tax=Stichopus japonicus TaxID=307972 RepID=A0A2G8KYT2_STIJA|nr:putative sn1-specific diacylglycerol lipase alpha [Apostichopus japonicus]
MSAVGVLVVYWSCTQGQNAFTEIAEIVSDFFRDIDIVPSDILAGLMLLREDQKKRRRAIEGNPGNDVITFLSGVPITPDTKYLDFTKEDDCSILSELHHYWKYAIASYGCSGYAMLHGSFKCLKLLSCRSSCITSQQRGDQTGRVQACCQCNYTALLELSGLDPNDIVFGTFHSAVWETPFFVALDHEHKKVILAIRGTSSVSDIVTDLCADTCPIPMEGCPPGFLGHKGMIAAAVYIKDKLQDEAILTQAFSCLPVDSDDYELLIVGHSLGAGAAAVLRHTAETGLPHLSKSFALAPPGVY